METYKVNGLKVCLYQPRQVLLGCCLFGNKLRYSYFFTALIENVGVQIQWHKICRNFISMECSPVTNFTVYNTVVFTKSEDTHLRGNCALRNL